jgi:hypothetical protein
VRAKSSSAGGVVSSHPELAAEMKLSQVTKGWSRDKPSRVGCRDEVVLRHSELVAATRLSSVN